MQTFMKAPVGFVSLARFGRPWAAGASPRSFEMGFRKNGARAVSGKTLRASFKRFVGLGRLLDGGRLGGGRLGGGRLGGGRLHGGRRLGVSFGFIYEHVIWGHL